MKLVSYYLFSSLTSHLVGERATTQGMSERLFKIVAWSECDKCLDDGSDRAL
jgi:hypothetical protein